jgi:hypothetical protein
MEGRPINTKINAGAIVQNNSRGCDSVKSLLLRRLNKVDNKLKPTIEIMRMRIVIAWS